jgi:hypothetical protein
MDSLWPLLLKQLKKKYYNTRGLHPQNFFVVSDDSSPASHVLFETSLIQ